MHVKEKLQNNPEIKHVRSTRAREGKVWFLHFKDDDIVYVLRLPFFHNIYWCSKNETKFDKEVDEIWWYMDIVGFHLDRLLDFHVIPHTTSLILKKSNLMPYIHMYSRRFGSLSKEKIREISAWCPRISLDTVDIDGETYF